MVRRRDPAGGAVIIVQSLQLSVLELLHKHAESILGAVPARSPCETATPCPSQKRDSTRPGKPAHVGNRQICILFGGAVKTREANQSDKLAVIELWERCHLTRPWNDPSQDFDFAHSGPSSTVIVLETEGAIAGAALVGHDGHRGSTYYVGVDPKLRGIGAGRALMAAVEHWLSARGIWKLNLLARFIHHRWRNRAPGMGARVIAGACCADWTGP
jgi:GNAT superfamily N-acetyltransferase